MISIKKLTLSFALLLSVIALPLAAQDWGYDFDGPNKTPPAEAPSTAPQMPYIPMSSFDLTEDMTVGGKFAPDEGPFSEEGLPKYGLPFVTGGYIYPAGTLQNGNGINEDGSPEYPNLVIGTWWCKGYFIQDFTAETQGPVVLTTQVFDFGNMPGEMTITTEGLESATVGQEIKRAITGGTGPYRSIKGQISQVLLGVNQSEGVNLRITLDAPGRGRYGR